LNQISVVRHNFDAFQARDFGAVLKHIDEDWRYVPGPYLDSPGLRYQGHDGYRSMLKATGWPEAEFELDVEMSRVDRYVMAAGTARIEGPQLTLDSQPTASLHLVVDGSIRWSRGFADERDALAAVASTVDDEFRLAFDGAPDAMALLDDQGRIVHANRAAGQLLGLPQRQLRGVGLERFAPPELRERALEYWGRFKREGQTGGTGALLAADGSRRLLEFRAATNYVAGRHLVIGRTRETDAGRQDGEDAVLTPRQREVLSLLAFGMNGPETASRLFLSPATVRTHVQNAMHALGAKTRAQAVAEALIRGEIDLHPPRKGGS
jgi:PAS domain S-box-containing protein